jgi:hypothetical protein
VEKKKADDRKNQLETYKYWSSSKSANGRYGEAGGIPFKFEWLKAGLRHVITWNGTPTWLVTAEQGSASFDKRGNGFVSVHYHIAKSEKADGGPGLTVIFSVVANKTTSLRLVGSVYRDGKEIMIDGRDFGRLDE